MAIDAGNLAGFAVHLGEIYESLAGSARLKAPYSDGDMEFSADGPGHQESEAACKNAVLAAIHQS